MTPKMVKIVPKMRFWVMFLRLLHQFLLILRIQKESHAIKTGHGGQKYFSAKYDPKQAKFGHNRGGHFLEIAQLSESSYTSLLRVHFQFACSFFLFDRVCRTGFPDRFFSSQYSTNFLSMFTQHLYKTMSCTLSYRFL